MPDMPLMPFWPDMPDMPDMPLMPFWSPDMPDIPLMPDCWAKAEVAKAAAITERLSAVRIDFISNSLIKNS